MTVAGGRVLLERGAGLAPGLGPDQETAIQAPGGGTKIAWGGPPVSPKSGKNRIHFDLAPPADGDQEGEVGAPGLPRSDAHRHRPGRGQPGVMADLDGNEFCVVDPR